jgi:hypothetical protein
MQYSNHSLSDLIQCFHVSKLEITNSNEISLKIIEYKQSVSYGYCFCDTQENMTFCIRYIEFYFDSNTSISTQIGKYFEKVF